MTQSPHRDVLQSPDTDTLATVKRMIADARHAAIATLAPEDGHPQATRVGLATLEDGAPLIFVSALAAHTPALLRDPRCALLIGEIGRGDPLAHPRVSLFCSARMVEPHSGDAATARARYLTHHPKAKLYADLPDFRFFVLGIERASFNAGFGRAFDIPGAELISAPSA